MSKILLNTNITALYPNRQMKNIKMGGFLMYLIEFISILKINACIYNLVTLRLIMSYYHSSNNVKFIGDYYHALISYRLPVEVLDIAMPPHEGSMYQDQFLRGARGLEYNCHPHFSLSFGTRDRRTWIHHPRIHRIHPLLVQPVGE